MNQMIRAIQRAYVAGSKSAGLRAVFDALVKEQRGASPAIPPVKATKKEKSAT
jgi:hypothetical protein